MAIFPRSRRDRRRDDDGVRGVSFELEGLEFVQASDELGLLRVAGLWFAPASQPLGELTLAVRRDSEALRLTPLPDATGAPPIATPDGGEWRGAFMLSVEVADDPRSEYALVAADDAEVALPRPGEWDELQDEEPKPEPAPEPVSPIVAELVARLDEVARLDDGAATEPAAASEPDSDPVVPISPPVVPMSAPPELAELRAELDAQRGQLAAARAELESERRRREALEEELRTHVDAEEQLRGALATQEAELASAVQASQRALRAERHRALSASSAAADHPERQRSRPLDEEFLARLEHARRASEAVSG